tara:strand:+ start:443 stop:670 length:228 start_codon:yes stop_codon:yes gene_type:complete
MVKTTTNQPDQIQRLRERVRAEIAHEIKIRKAHKALEVKAQAEWDAWHTPEAIAEQDRKFRQVLAKTFRHELMRF